MLDIPLVAFSCLTSICLVHATWYPPETGSSFAKCSWCFKLLVLVLVLISMSGILWLAGVKGFQVGDQYDKPNNLTWDKFWEGSGTGLSALLTVCIMFYGVNHLACCIGFLLTNFVGCSSVNSVLSEVRDPVRTIKLAAPLAMISVYSLTFHISLSSPRKTLESQRIITVSNSSNEFVDTTEKVSFRQLASFLLPELTN